MNALDLALKRAADRRERRRRQRRADKPLYAAAHATEPRYIKQRTNAGSLPFIGVDGEGGGTDDIGRQNFLLLCAGDMELFNDNKPLSTVDCLEFILAQPADAILVGYYFTYDATQILRDLPENRLRWLMMTTQQKLEQRIKKCPLELTPEQREDYFNDPLNQRRVARTFWGEYAIEFVPRQFFSVARCNRNGRIGVLAGSARTINEVGGFFQKSFVEAIKDWGVGSEKVQAMIADNKERRSGFTQVDNEIRQYCAAECFLLAELMTKLRDVCAEVDMIPKQWRGAGWLAARLHEKHETPKRKKREPRPAALDDHAIMAYYGGRFEVMRVGRIPGPIYEYDINSAYPAAMLSLPCPLHTEWAPFSGIPSPLAGCYVADVHFHHNADMPLCGLPVRQKGKLFWPREGRGVYWGVEIHAMLATGRCHVEFLGGWRAERRCDCKPFAWVEAIYEYRKSLGKSTVGYPLKLGINGLYGKLAQRQGGAPWRNHIAAGLITATVRAKLIDAYASDPSAVVMIATDSVFSFRPLKLDIGPNLGQWEETQRHSGVFIVQPGIYWSPGSDKAPKTRGIPRSKIIAQRDDFERAWGQWCAGDGGDEPPAVTIPLTNFIGHRLALARGKVETAGSWVAASKTISFDWSNKRRLAGRSFGGMVETDPFDGGPWLRSESYDPAALTDYAEQELESEAEPDYEPLGNTGE